MDGLTPEEYESRTGITKVEYEQRVLDGARAAALEVYPPGSSDATIQVIELDGLALDTALVVLFGIPARPNAGSVIARSCGRPTSPRRAAHRRRMGPGASISASTST